MSSGVFKRPADWYDRYRPVVPDAIIRYLHGVVGVVRPKVVDVACGTELSTVAWRGGASIVHAVEPAAEMFK
jgi:hypothetical protein